ncbi:MAG: DUF1631 family protein [Pseudomonadota bacterium]
MQPRSGRSGAILKALTHRYPTDEVAEQPLDREALLNYIDTIEPETLASAESSVLMVFERLGIDQSLARDDRALLAYLDEALALIDHQTDFDPKALALLHSAIPFLAHLLIENPTLPESKKPSALHVIDAIASGLVGWSADLGRAAERTLGQLQDVMGRVVNNEEVGTLLDDLESFRTKEHARIEKLEGRLIATEQGQIRAHQSRTIAGNMINSAMADKQLTPTIVQFLKETWFDSMQLLVIRHGRESPEWHSAIKLTETIVWTYQPIDNSDELQKLYRILEDLAEVVSRMLLSTVNEDDARQLVEGVMGEEHVTIISGEPLDFQDFDPIECDDPITSRQRVAKHLRQAVRQLQVGQWFRVEVDEKTQRIKLVLKLDDIGQLLFTNANGIKAMQKSFDEFAYLMSSGVVQPINSKTLYSSTLQNLLLDLVEEYQEHVEAAAERKAERERVQAERDAARKKALDEAAALAREREEAEIRDRQERRDATFAHARAEAAKSENQARVAELTEMVAHLSIGAWVALPNTDGVMTECKLGVRIARANKLIFVTRTGNKVGEYSVDELVQLLLIGEAEIEDQGVEFEDTLAQVVSRLRKDRDKSYDDLTGQ